MLKCLGDVTEVIEILKSTEVSRAQTKRSKTRSVDGKSEHFGPPFQRLSPNKLKPDKQPGTLRNPRLRPDSIFVAVTRSVVAIRQIAPQVVEVAVAGCALGIVALSAEEPKMAIAVNPTRRIAAAAGSPDVVGLIGT